MQRTNPDRIINIDVMSDAAYKSDRISSKGNQNKWTCQGIWYKADSLGYEALAEVLISRLLEKTNANLFVRYSHVWLKKRGSLLHGCQSENFLTPEDDKVVSVERLFQTYYGESAAKAVLRYAETGDRIQYVTECLETITGIQDFGGYLRMILTIDALFLNEDRHFHNLAVIRRKDGSFRKCPVFDNGAALFSDIRNDYPLDMELAQCFERTSAKPFSRSFDEQLDACEALFKDSPFRAAFTMKDVDIILEEFTGIYEAPVLTRVREVMRWQMRKYGYLFTRIGNQSKLIH